MTEPRNAKRPMIVGKPALIMVDFQGGDGTYIPGNMNVGIGAYELHRDPRYFGKPNEFIPEQWLGEGPEPFDRNAIAGPVVRHPNCDGPFQRRSHWHLFQ